MVHKPEHKVHSFRGLLSDGGQDEINLERSNVNLAYRIVKFQIMPEDPQTATQEIVAKIYREEQTSIDGAVDFGNPDILGVALYAQHSSSYTSFKTVIFDNTLFSRNIYVTVKDAVGAGGANWYVELEEVPVGAATLMQLKLGVARKLIGGSMGK